jgi:N-acyl-D-aspartate/D-glutamate deacylase
LLLVWLLATPTAILRTAHSRTKFANPTYDLVATNARIVDGSGNPWFRADVGVRDGRIVRVGRDARARGLMVTVDQYAYTASSTSLESRIPSWFLAGGREEAKKRLADPATRERLVSDMKDALKRSGFKDYDYAVVASYGPDHSFNGKSIAAITKQVKNKTDVKNQIDQIIDTSLPAQTFGFRDRGLIREGFAADLVIFDENTILDRATYDQPHQFPVGISYVVVNGITVLANDQMTTARPGMPLRANGFQGAS